MPLRAVAIVVYEGVQALGQVDVFSEANSYLDKHGSL
jgi:hypothetical protein